MNANWVVVLSGAVVGGAVNLVESAPVSVVERPEAVMSAVRPSGPFSCAGGAEYEVSVEPLVDAVERVAGRDRLSYHLEFQNASSEELVIAYAWTFTDDRGKVLDSGRSFDVSVLAKEGSVASPVFTTPSSLDDGFYRATFLVAALGAQVETVRRVDWWLEMGKGHLVEVDSGEWHQRGRSHQMFAEQFHEE